MCLILSEILCRLFSCFWILVLWFNLSFNSIKEGVNQLNVYNFKNLNHLLKCNQIKFLLLSLIFWQSAAQQRFTLKHGHKVCDIL